MDKNIKYIFQDSIFRYVCYRIRQLLRAFGAICSNASARSQSFRLFSLNSEQISFSQSYLKKKTKNPVSSMSLLLC